MLEVREMKPPICKGEEMPRISATKSFTATTAALGRTPSPPPPSFKYYAATDTISGKVRSAAAAIHITQQREWDIMQSWASCQVTFEFGAIKMAVQLLVMI